MDERANVSISGSGCASRWRFRFDCLRSVHTKAAISIVTVAVAIAFPEVEVVAEERGLVAEIDSCPGPRTQTKARARVVGGYATDVDYWPGQVALRLYNPDRSEAGYVCGGSVISEHWVLTAAHCVYGLSQEARSQRYYSEFDQIPPFKALGFAGRGYLQVVLNTDDLRSVDPASVTDVAEVVVHSGYDQPQIHKVRQQPDLTGHDIALLRLDRPWRGPYARLALKSAADPATPPGAAVMVAGFGSLEWMAELELFNAAGASVFAAGSPKLQEVDLPTIAPDSCRETYPYAVVGAGQLCAGHDDTQKDSCQGDSGGQLVAFDANGCPYQIGIVSWGEKCAEPGRYGVYTRVSHYAEWIRDTVPATEALFTVKDRDLIDWTAAAKTRELAYAALGELERLMAPAKNQVRIGLRHKEGGANVPDNKVRVDERYLLEITSEVAGRLIVIDVDAEGKVTQIFPNQFLTAANAGQIDAGETLTVPGRGYGFDWFKAVPPAGGGRLLAFVVPEDFPVERTVASGQRLERGFQPERAPANYLMSLNTQAYNTLQQHSDGRVSPARWAIRVVDYEIVD